MDFTVGVELSAMYELHVYTRVYTVHTVHALYVIQYVILYKESRHDCTVSYSQ